MHRDTDALLDAAKAHADTIHRLVQEFTDEDDDDCSPPPLAA